MVNDQRPRDPKITKLATDKMFFEIFDCLEDAQHEDPKKRFSPQYRQLRFVMLNHQMKVDGKSAWVHFSIHERDFLLLRNLLLSRKLGRKADGAHFVLYRGGDNTKYETGVQSRVLEVEKQPPMNEPRNPDATNRAKVLFTIQNGPGVRGKTKQVMPAKGGAPLKLMFPMDEGVALAMVEEIYLYLTGWHARYSREIFTAHRAWAEYQSGNDDGVILDQIEDPDAGAAGVPAGDVY